MFPRSKNRLLESRVPRKWQARFGGGHTEKVQKWNLAGCLPYFNDYWGRWTRTGVHGDPTKATAEKGRLLFEAAVTGLVELVDELRAWPIEKRQEMHRGPVQSEIRW
jgi:hypothetical protein